MSKWANTIYDENVKFTTPLPDKNFLSSLSKDTNILDIGCGYGRTLIYLRNLGFNNLTGFDISQSYIDRAVRDCPCAKLFVDNFESFNLKNTYDLILLMGVIEYVITDRQQDLFFEKISNNLSTNGYVLLETFTIDFKKNWRQYISGLMQTFHWGRFKNSKGFDCHHQSSKTLIKYLKKYFIIESSLEKKYTTWTDNVCNGHYFILRKK